MATDGFDAPIGAVLRDFREEKQLTQEALAAMAKLHPNYIGGIERGERNPTVRSIGRILRVLGMTWTDLGVAMDERIRR